MKLSEDYCKRHTRHNRWWKVKARELNQFVRRHYWSLARKWKSQRAEDLFYERHALVHKPVMSKEDSERVKRINWILGEEFGLQDVWMSEEDQAIHKANEDELWDKIITDLKAEGRW